jgi:hypothetical protein
MKNKLYTLLISIFVLVSCADDFTDIAPVGALSDAALNNATGVDLLLTGAYSVLDGMRNGGPGAQWAKQGNNWWLDVISDDAHKGSTDGDQADLYALEIYQWETSNPYIEGRWGAIFAGVNRANGVIVLINGSEDPAAYTTQLAQARFLRGHFNFELQRMWVNVPFISDQNFADTEFNQPNSGAIWTQIEEDFSFAAANLPSIRGGAYSEPGRPLSSAAKAYLGRSQLYQSKWGEALTNLEAVINSGNYALLPNYVDNWVSSGENGSEAIFAIQYSTDTGQSPQGDIGGVLNFPAVVGCCGFYQPTQDLFNAFETDADGLPLLDTYNQSDLASDYGIYSGEPFTPTIANLDPRVDFYNGRRGIEYNGYGLNPGKDWVRATFGDISGPYVSKKNVFQASDEATNKGTGGWGELRTGINHHIIRYADVLLMAAEAAVESGDLVKGQGYVNQVRQRAKTSARIQAPGGGDAANYVIDTYNTAWSDAATARKAVRFERRLELSMEGSRLFDLRRWGVMVQTLNTYIANETRSIPTFSKAQAVSEKHNALPIPSYAIDQSTGALKQNSGH